MIDKFYQLLGSLEFTKRWKSFVFSFVAVFIMVIIPKLGMTIPALISPLPKTTDIFQKISPRLNLYNNNYSLKKTSSLITPIYADMMANNALGYLVVDYKSGEVLADNNSDKKLPIASLTKIMSAAVALDLADKDELFEAKQDAAEIIPTKLGVLTGEKLKLEELLNAMMLTSANDASQIVKDGIDQKYNSEVFVQAMNEKTKYLGLKNTHFSNPQGFDSPDNYSSAQDLAILCHYVLTNYPIISSMVKKDYQFYPADSNHRLFDLYNWNGLLGVYPNITGFKIGNTRAAKSSIIVLSEREGNPILVVLLGAPGTLERDLWASQLLDLGYQKKYSLATIGVTEQQLRDKYKSWKPRDPNSDPTVPL